MAHIDWLSFTLPYVPQLVGEGEPPHREALNTILAFSPTLYDLLATVPDFAEGSGRAPFKHSIRSSAEGIAIFYGHKSRLVLLEFSGGGCRWLVDRMIMDHVLETFSDRVTRIDIAHDWETETKPAEFAALRDEGRFKSIGNFDSASGQTVYIGSRTSERYARVYRYAPPHPRAHLMRVEIVLRKEMAKVAADYCLRNGVLNGLLAIGEAFGWAHPLWDGLKAGEQEEIQWRPREKGGSTLRWLYKQVSPAVKKVLESGDTEGVKDWLTELVQMFYDYDASSDIVPHQ